MDLPKIRYKKHLRIHGLYDLPQKITQERLKILTEEIKKDINVKINKEEIILGHLRLGAAISAYYNKNYQGNDDLFGAAQLAIVQAVKIFPYDHHTNITSYITVKIHSYIKEFIGNNRIFGPASRTIRSWHESHDEKSRNISMQVAIITEGALGEKMDDSNQPVKSRTNRTSIFAVIPQIKDDHKDMEIKEVLNAVTFDFIEKKIIELKIEGYTLEEIGKQVGYGRSKISEILKEIEIRFYERYGKKLG